MAAVTARGVVDGDHAALDGLSTARGRAVLAYCEQVCGPGAALGAAIQAFAAFREAAVSAPDPLAIDPERLLLSKTRHAAAACVHVTPRRRASLCPDVPGLLAKAADGTLEPRDRDRLRRHLARCSDCRELQREQQAAERAYRRPTRPALTEAERVVIVAALTAAAPLAGPAARTNGPASQPQPVPVPKPEPVMAEAEHASIVGLIPVVPVVAPVAAESAAEPVLAAPIEEDAPEPATQAFETVGSAPPPPRRRFVASGGTARERMRPAVLTTRSGPGRGGHGGLAARVVAPAAVLLVALLGVLAVAGVFSSGRSHQRTLATTPPAPLAAPPSAASLPVAPAPRRHRHRRRKAAARVRRPIPTKAAVTTVTPVTRATSPSATAQPTPARARSLTVHEGPAGSQVPAQAPTTTTGGFTPN